MPGTVFLLELVTSARRPRTYIVRAAYGLGLLAVAGAASRGAFPGGGGSTVPAGELARFARGLFEGFVLAQGVAVVVLAPALAAGAVAGEAQRKTLDDLLTTELSAAEILAGKAAARLTQVAALILAGLPALLVAAEVGGLGPWAAVGSLAATLSTAAFLAGLALLASTQARSTRGALNATLTLALTWMIVPGSVGVLLPRAGPWGQTVFEWVGPLNAWVEASSPFSLWLAVSRGSVRSPGALAEKVLWMMGHQLAFGAVFLGLASALLRPSARGGSRRRRRKTRTAKVTARPPCGDDPMRWKELVVSRVPTFYRPLGMVVGLALLGLLVWATIAFALPALGELIPGGYGVAAARSSRSGFLVYLRVVVTGVYLVYAFGVASDAAAGMTSERENDTWISLLTAPLSGVEIVRAKVLGAVWGVRQTAVVFVLLTLTGCVAGSVHPLGLAAVVTEVVAFTVFAAALGTFVSLRAASTPRAVALTAGWLVAINGVSVLLIAPLAHGRPLAHLGCTPWVLAASLVSFGDVRGVLSFGELGVLSDRPLAALWAGQTPEMVATCLLTTFAYAAAGGLLYRATCRGFDSAIDRPPTPEVETASVDRLSARFARPRRSRHTRQSSRAR